MKKIQEVIVVEGKHDSDTLKKYFACDTIETGGLALNEETIAFIQAIQKKRGIIILTDPDSPGNRIREWINQKVSGCKNAFVEKKYARTDKKVGVEHASKEALEEALENVVVFQEEPSKQINQSILYELGLVGQDKSAQLRYQIGDFFHIGNCNAKTFCYRMNCLGITKEELEEAVNKI